MTNQRPRKPGLIFNLIKLLVDFFRNISNNVIFDTDFYVGWITIQVFSNGLKGKNQPKPDPILARVWLFTFLSVPLGGSEAAIEGVELGALEGDAAGGDVATIGVATGGGCADPCCWPHDDHPASENEKVINL